MPKTSATLDFDPVFYHFHGGRETVSFPPPIRDVKQPGCFRPRDDNAAVNTYTRAGAAPAVKLGSHDVVLEIGR